MIHELKILSEYFEAVISGKKTFEIRKDDRGYAVGDLLALNEYIKNEQAKGGGYYTGNSCLVYVDYILYGEYCKDLYVTMSIKPCVVHKVKKPIDQFKFEPDYSVPLATRKEQDNG